MIFIKRYIKISNKNLSGKLERLTTKIQLKSIYSLQNFKFSNLEDRQLLYKIKKKSCHVRDIFT